jgi:hypothetical protein
MPIGKRHHSCLLAPPLSWRRVLFLRAHTSCIRRHPINGRKVVYLLVDELLTRCDPFSTPDEMTRLAAEAERLLGEARQSAEPRSSCVNGTEL